ncbi:MAG: DUF2059 domain-containing protein [Microcoleaceae cyanobacterium]
MFQQTNQMMLTQFQQDFPQILAEGQLPGLDNLSPEERRDAIQEITSETNRILEKFGQRLIQELSFDEIVERVYYPLYNKYYTEADLEALIEFYKTPIGQKSIQVTPQLLQESFQLTSEVIQPKVINIIREVLAEEMEQFGGQ